MPGVLYRLVFSPEVEKKLASGAATVQRDRSGLLLPVGKGPRPLAGLPRFESSAAGLGRLAAAWLGVANVVASGFEVLNDRRGRGTAALADTSRDLLVEGCAAALRRTRKESEPRSRRGDSRYEPLARALATSTLDALALLTHVRDLETNGMEPLLDMVDSAHIAAETPGEALHATVRGECERIADAELRKAAYTIAEAEDAIGRFDRHDEPG